MVLRLADIQAAGIAVPEMAFAEFGFDGLAAPQGRGKADQQLVGTLIQLARHRDAARHEHVLTLQNQLAVEPYLREGVQAVEAQIGLLA